MVTVREKLLANSSGGTVRNALLTLYTGGPSDIVVVRELTSEISLNSIDGEAKVVNISGNAVKNMDGTVSFINKTGTLYKTYD